MLIAQLRLWPGLLACVVICSSIGLSIPPIGELRTSLGRSMMTVWYYQGNGGEDTKKGV